MPTAKFVNGFIHVNGSNSSVPYFYSSGASASIPPYTLQYSGNNAYVSVYTGNIGLPYTAVEGNLGSPLVVKSANVLRGSWATLVAEHDNTYHKMLDFGNGKTIWAKYDSGTAIQVRAYNGDTLIGEFSWDVVDTDNPIEYALFTVLISDNTFLFETITLRNWWGALYSIVIEPFLSSTADYTYCTHFLPDGSVIEINEDPYQFVPDSIDGGGHGDFDYSGDPVLPPELPTISVANSGFITLFAPDISELQSLASYMWSGLFDVASFKKLFADPMDCILALSIVPVNVPTGGSMELKVGNIGTGLQLTPLTQQFIKVKFATKNIGLRTKSFMDFAPYVKMQLFLPYIGMHSLSPDDIIGSDIDIEYHIDLYSGACTAYVTCAKTNSDGSPIHSTLYQFTGNICATVPFTATNYANFFQSLLNAASAASVSVATGGAGAVNAIGSAIDVATSMKPEVERSGNISANNGFLGIQKPYLIVTYPNLCKPAGRDKTVGTPSFIGLTNTKKLSSFKGFTKLHKVNMIGFSCTDEEKRLIESKLMNEGIIL